MKAGGYDINGSEFGRIKFLTQSTFRSFCNKSFEMLTSARKNVQVLKTCKSMDSGEIDEFLGKHNYNDFNQAFKQRFVLNIREAIKRRAGMTGATVRFDPQRVWPQTFKSANATSPTEPAFRPRVTRPDDRIPREVPMKSAGQSITVTSTKGRTVTLAEKDVAEAKEKIEKCVPEKERTMPWKQVSDDARSCFIRAGYAGRLGNTVFRGNTPAKDLITLQMDRIAADLYTKLGYGVEPEAPRVRPVVVAPRAADPATSEVEKKTITAFDDKCTGYGKDQLLVSLKGQAKTDAERICAMDSAQRQQMLRATDYAKLPSWLKESLTDNGVSEAQYQRHFRTGAGSGAAPVLADPPPAKTCKSGETLEDGECKKKEEGAGKHLMLRVGVVAGTGGFNIKSAPVDSSLAYQSGTSKSVPIALGLEGFIGYQPSAATWYVGAQLAYTYMFGEAPKSGAGDRAQFHTIMASLEFGYGVFKSKNEKTKVYIGAEAGAGVALATHTRLGEMGDDYKTMQPVVGGGASALLTHGMWYLKVGIKGQYVVDPWMGSITSEYAKGTALAGEAKGKVKGNGWQFFVGAGLRF